MKPTRPVPGRLARTRLASAVFAMMMVLGLTVSVPPASAVSDPALVDLGPAMEATDVGAIAAGPDLEGGGLIYVTTSGHPTTFTVLDAETNEVVFQQTMTGDEYLTAKVIDTKAGLTYFSYRSAQATQIWVYDVRENTVEPVVQTCASCEIDKPVFRVFDVAEDGTLYMGAYPDAAVYSYDPETKKVRDYGSVFTEGEYVWGLTLSGDQLFVGTGNGPDLGRLFQIDTASGDIQQVPFPDGALTPRVIGELQAVGDVVLVPLSGDPNPIRFYDKGTQDWVCSDLQAPGFPQPTDAFDEDPIDGVSYFRSEGSIWELDLDACSYREVVDLAAHDLDGVAFTGVKAIPTGDVDDPEVWRLVMFAPDGRSVIIDPDTGELELRESNVLPSTVTTHSLGLGPEGELYIGAYLSPYVMGRLDPTTDEVTVLSGPEQSDSVTTIGDQLMVTSYPNAVVHLAGADEPWDWDTNPRKVMDGTADDQDRIFEVVDADGLAVFGSIPKYGLLGGGITVLDPVSEEYQTYTGLIGEQSVGALAHRSGVVYGGTTVRGGIGSEPDPDAEAEMFVFDMASRTVTHSAVAVPGASTIGGLTFGRGQLWGITDTGVIFRYDLRSREAVEAVEIPGGSRNTNWGRLPDLQFNRMDGLFYGISATRQVFTFNGRTHEVRIIDDEHEMGSLQVMPDGRVYLINETNVFSLDHQ